jgi:hypothetical protein
VTRTVGHGSEVVLADRHNIDEFASGAGELMVLDWEDVRAAAEAAFNVVR